MKASEIVEKLKSVLLSADEPQVELAAEVEEIEVNDPEVVLADDVPAEDEASPEDVAEDTAEEADKYATKEELESAIAEMKAMYEAIVEKMGSAEMEVEVPTEELSAQKPQKEELSSQEDGASPLTHSPSEVNETRRQLLTGNKTRTTMSVVYEKMFNK